MNRHTPPLVSGILAALLLAYTPQSDADHPQLKASVDDYDLFLSLVPARRIAQYPELAAHGHPVESVANQYHVELAVVDRRTGQHVEDAEVQITAASLDSDARDFSLTRVNDSPAYCSLVTLQTGDLYSFDATVELEALTKPLEVGTWSAGK